MLDNLIENLIKTAVGLLAILAALLAFTYWPEHGQVFASVRPKCVAP